MRPGQDVLDDRAAPFATDWLLSNGVGGSASGTPGGTAPRRHHGWLVAGAAGAPRLLLAGAAERLRTPAGTFDLAGPAVPAGPRAPLEPRAFRCDPFPVWTYEAGGAALERLVMPVPGFDAVAIRYRHAGGTPFTLTISPLLVSRPLDGRQEPDPAFGAAGGGVPGRIRIALGDDALTLFHNGAFLPARLWRAIGHEREPPPADRESAFVPGHLEATLAPGAALVVVAATREDLFRALAGGERLGSPPPRTLAECCERLELGERADRSRWIAAALVGADLTAHQALAARREGDAAGAAGVTLRHRGDGWSARLAGQLLEGLVRRGPRLTMAGSLPGAAESGSAALRCVPALIALRAFEPARDLLQGAVEYLDEGLAPGRWETDGTPVYGDPRPALWLLHGAELYARRSGDLDFARAVLLPACESVVQFHRAGTHFGVGVGSDGLLRAGAECDAVTNLLWSHGLVATAQLARALDRRESAAFHLAWARDHQQRFLAAFTGPDGVLGARPAGAAPAGGLVPELVLALALAPPLLAGEPALRLLEAIESRLATPLGLRAAAGSDRVLPEWLGPFAAATLRVRGRDEVTVARVAGWFDALAEAAPGAVPGTLVLGGAAVRPEGDPLSPVAAAELLRCWIEDLEPGAVTA